MKLIGLTALGTILAATALSGGNAVAADAKYVIGASNTLIGNGFREEMVCSIKAQAAASGIVSKVVLANRNGGPPEQISDIRNLISAGVNAIIFNPSDRAALDPVIKQAEAKGIVMVAVDQAVSAPGAYIVENDQVAYGRIGATWLFEQLKGKGAVVEMRGIDGVPADADRHQGFEEALKKFPGITVAAMTFTGWAPDKGAQQIKDLLASGKQIDGIWTSGIDSIIADAYKTAGKKYVPTVGTDNNGFVGQLISLKGDGFTGAVVTNPPVVGGAGVTIALDVLQKKAHPHLTHLKPEAWPNTTADGVDILKKVYDPKLGTYYSVDTELKGLTTFSRDQLLACKGPGEG